MLDELGIDYVEGGYPGANPLDTEFFAQRPKLRARFAAFGMTRRQGRSVENDPGVAALLDSAPTSSPSSPRAGTFRSASPYAPRKKTISQALRNP